MSVLNQIVDASMPSGAGLLRSREFYSPCKGEMSPEVTLARWTQRLATQTELGSAREIAGLSEAEFAILEQEFTRCQNRPQAPLVKRVIASAILLGALGGALLAAGTAAVGFDIGGASGRVLQGSGLAVLFASLSCTAVGFLTASSSLNLDVAYGTLGLYVGQLNEQHPWLYKTTSLLQHQSAERYRRSILAERGSLRGVDYVIMRELAAANESLEQIRPARVVAAQLQSHAAEVSPPATGPRLAEVGDDSSLAALEGRHVRIA